jgi:hypothetical protein
MAMDVVATMLVGAEGLLRVGGVSIRSIGMRGMAGRGRRVRGIRDARVDGGRRSSFNWIDMSKVRFKLDLAFRHTFCQVAWLWSTILELKHAVAVSFSSIWIYTAYSPFQVLFHGLRMQCTQCQDGYIVEFHAPCT